jgi:hypothetical protein
MEVSVGPASSGLTLTIRSLELTLRRVAICWRRVVSYISKMQREIIIISIKLLLPLLTILS